ncbi:MULTISPECIES: hypothetical protein [Corynebacterium]|uniref:hypothetical protein n=1 Tax=Corynebacterium TaxID=1716 RepID=UPI00124CDE1E|nr:MULTISPECIES: hypothetical protein [Corynebacterium]
MDNDSVDHAPESTDQVFDSSAASVAGGETAGEAEMSVEQLGKELGTMRRIRGVCGCVAPGAAA